MLTVQESQHILLTVSKSAQFADRQQNMLTVSIFRLASPGEQSSLRVLIHRSEQSRNIADSLSVGRHVARRASSSRTVHVGGLRAPGAREGVTQTPQRIC